MLVEVARPEPDGLGAAELIVLKSELKTDLDAYLADTPAAVTTRTLADVIAFHRAHAAEEMPFFGQELFEQAQATRGVDDPAYKAAAPRARSLAKGAIDGVLKQANATVLVEPTYAAAWLSDPAYGDQYGGPSASEWPAVAGYPHLTVPMGLIDGLPVGLSFIATGGADAAVLGAGYAYERRAGARVAPRYLPTAAVATGLDGLN